MKVLNIYTDGSYRSNTKKGAYGFVIPQVYPVYSFVQEETHTSNNKMEMKAVQSALKHILDNNLEKDYDRIVIYSDSEYVVKTLNIWWPKWMANNFITAKGHPVKNLELWKEIKENFDLTTKVDIVWVKGHDKNAFNQQIDALVQKATESPN